MSAEPQEIHVGDIGTNYRIRLVDNGTPFDPSDAAQQQIVFGLPQGQVTKSATVVQVGDNWFLSYTVDESTFHSTVGMIKMQGVLIYGDGRTFRTNIISKDEQGRTLYVYPNL